MSDTQNQWIPVSERLPYADTTNKLVFANGIKCIAWCDCYCKGNVPRWCEPLKTEELKGVTHWMDLPEPPAPPKPVDPFEAWWHSYPTCETQSEAARAAWNAAKEHYAKPLPDFETWWNKLEQHGCKARGFKVVIMRQDLAMAVWNAAQGKPEA